MLEATWEEELETLPQGLPELADELVRRLEGRLPNHWDEGLPEFPRAIKGSPLEYHPERCSMPLQPNS